MDPGQESEAVVSYLRKNTDTVAATSVCNISAGLLIGQGGQRQEGLDHHWL